VYLGLTDEEVPGEVPDVPEVTEAEIDFLLATVNRALRIPVCRQDVLGAFAGLRPLLDGGTGRTADLSRRHAVITSPDGLVTVIGGKLTTYRRMAQHALDTALERRGVEAGPCVTHRLALVGAAGHTRVIAPPRLVRKYGGEALVVLAEADGDPALLAPVADGVDTTGAELRFAVRHEGALDIADLLDRRTRIGLVPADRKRAVPTAQRVLSEA
jgi:glycerol-3-phosphate dehydrogenase